MTPEQEVRRGEEAAALLRNPLYIESWDAVRNNIITQLESADIAPERRARLNDLLVAHRKAKQYLDRVVAEGKMAAQRIEPPTLLERAQGFLRR